MPTIHAKKATLSDLNEKITKAQQCAAMLADDVVRAYQTAERIEWPEGRTRSDKALAEYLSECATLARELETKLLYLGD